VTAQAALAQNRRHPVVEKLRGVCFRTLGHRQALKRN
jgi:hypothetical protein